MKRFHLILLIAYLFTACNQDNTLETNPQGEGEIGLNFSIQPYNIPSRALDYASTITNMRILIFDMTGLLYHQIVLPTGSNAPKVIRLPWGKYNFIFAGNFPNLSVTEGVTTINNIIATMPDNPNFTAPDICVAPTDNYYYYMVPAPVQIGVVNTINVTLRPITAQVTVNIMNMPIGTYNTYDLEIWGIGQNLSMQGNSLPPVVRVVNYGLTATTGTVTSTLKTFAGIGTSSIRLYARAITYTDTLTYAFKTPIQTGQSSITNLIFHPVDLTMPQPTKIDLDFKNHIGR